MPSSYRNGNGTHRILGFILLILATVQILVVTKNKNKIFIPILVISAVSWVVYLLVRFFRPNLQGYTALSNQLKPNQKLGENRLGLQSISNSQDLAKLGGQYFIFADKVYDIHNVLASHPGGYELIKNIKGREVDRYIYGSEPLEAVKKMYLHGHTSNSMKLAGSPVGVFNSTVPFTNMQEVNIVMIERKTSPCKSIWMCAPYLASKSSTFPLQFNGYESLSQLGKYYSLTINENLTRLYSVVNFLHLANVELLAKLAGRSFQSFLPISGDQVQLSERRVATTAKFDNVNCIPLLIKKYQKGSFTKKLLGDKFHGKIKISKPLGRGLNLSQIPAGQLIVFAGGTGINPFCDLIDLLYKEFLIFQGDALSRQIIKLNPVLQNQSVILNKYLISIFYSVNDAEELNQITAYQLNRLAQSKIVSAYIRANKNDEDLFRNYPSLGRLERKFEEYVPGLADRLDRISQIYVCGPPAMAEDLVQAFGQNKIPNFRYKIM